jgi:hypothetical protein
MANIFLSANETFSVGPGSVGNVFGLTGGLEKVIFAAGATGSVDGNVERVDLSASESAYTFKISGNVITVLSGGTTVTTVVASGTQTIAFADGAAALLITGLNTATLGGTTIPTTAGPVVSTSLIPPGASTTSVSAAGTSDASIGNITYQVAAPGASYTFNITGFAAGDKLVSPAGSAFSITNTSATDGIIDVAMSLGAATVTIHLVGVALAQDSTVFNLASFNTAFGAGSLA